jgi:hypothetical protein
LLERGKTVIGAPPLAVYRRILPFKPLGEAPLR